MKKFVGIALALTGLWACGPEKAKPDLAQDFATSMDKAETAAGRWTEVQVVDSPHPYRDNFSRIWNVDGAADAEAMRVVLERFELESGYDFLSVAGRTGDATRFTGTRTGEEIVVNGNRAVLSFTSDYSVTGWGFRARVYERRPCACIAIHQPVCGADGVTYGNACSATCEGVSVSHAGECAADWFRVERIQESAHPYANDVNQTITIAEGGASRIRLHFARIDVERGYDFVRVLDRADNVVASYTGIGEDITTVEIAGDTAKVRFTSDYSVTSYGYRLDWYEVQGGCTANSCGPGEQCMQIQCIRAPCFSSCQPASNTGFTEVTTAQMEANPMQYNGRAVRVVAEPTAFAVCTRRGCPANDPCCNACTAALRVGTDIELRDATDQPYACSGNECSWQASCREFRPENAGPYQFEGTFHADQFSMWLTAQSFRAMACQRAGCSGQACANTNNVITTCDFRPEYACYAQTPCEAQNTGHCGYTQTPALQMCLDAVNNPAGRTVSATDTPLAIPDNSQNGVGSRIEVNAGLGAVTRARVSVGITHTYRGDLRVTLVAPSGREAVLHDRAGGSRDDVILENVEVPSVAGESINGAWRLVVRDLAAADVGTLNSWSITLD